jgi:hypothetical protein
MFAQCEYWQHGEQWLGYFDEFPNYMTQSDSLENLKNTPGISKRI